MAALLLLLAMLLQTVSLGGHWAGRGSPTETLHDVLHWSGHYQTANTMCIACHTTGFEKRYDAASDSYTTTFSEINVACFGSMMAAPMPVFCASNVPSSAIAGMTECVKRIFMVVLLLCNGVIACMRGQRRGLGI